MGEDEAFRARAKAAGYSDAEIDDYLAKEKATTANPLKKEGLKNLGRSAAQGVTFGFGDEILGKLPEWMGGGEAARDEMRANDAAFKSEHPWISAGAELAGGLAVPGLGAVKTLGTGVKTIRGAAAAGAGLGGLSGGLYGAGSAEGGLGERAQAAVAPAALGVAGGALIPGGGAILKSLKPSTRANTRMNVAVARSGGVDKLLKTLDEFKAAGRGDDVMAADLSIPMRQATDFAANASEDAAEKIGTKAYGRQADASDRILQDTRSVVGNPRADKIIEDLKDETATWARGSEGYGGLRAANEVIEDPEVANKFKAFLTGKTPKAAVAQGETVGPAVIKYLGKEYDGPIHAVGIELAREEAEKAGKKFSYDLVDDNWFRTSTGRLVGRKEARRIAEAAGGKQAPTMRRGGAGREDDLFAEAMPERREQLPIYDEKETRSVGRIMLDKQRASEAQAPDLSSLFGKGAYGHVNPKTPSAGGPLQKLWGQARKVGLIGPMPKADKLSFEVLDDTKQMLDDAVDAAYKSGRGNLGERLKAARDELVGMMEDNIPEYGAVRAQYHQKKSLERMVEAGQEAFKSKDTRGLSELVGGLDTDQLTKFREGMASEMIVGLRSSATNKDIAKSLVEASPAQKDKIRVIFGSNKLAGEFMEKMRVERELSKVLATLTGSQTAKRIAAQQGIDALEVVADVATLPVAPWSGASRLAGLFRGATRNKVAGSTAKRLGATLSTQGAPAIEELLKSLRKNPRLVGRGAALAPGRIGQGASLLLD